jgi:hypothetical protein
MLDPVSLLASTQVAPVSVQQPQLQTRFDPSDTKLFKALMHGHGTHPAETSGGPALQQIKDAVEARFGTAGPSFEDLRRGMTENASKDPASFQIGMANLTVGVMSRIAGLHALTSLTTAVTNLFGTILKPQ